MLLLFNIYYDLSISYRHFMFLWIFSAMHSEQISFFCCREPKMSDPDQGSLMVFLSLYLGSKIPEGLPRESVQHCVH